MKQLLRFIYINIIDSHLWYHLYYKHTAKHKKECKDTKDRVLEIRMKTIGK